MTAPALSVSLRFVARETQVRKGEPVTCGLPWPRGAVHDEKRFRLVGSDGIPAALQTRVLDRWPDGSVRWCLFDFLATVDGKSDGYRVEAGEPVSLPPLPDFPVQAKEHEPLFALSAADASAKIVSDVAGQDVIESGPIRRRFALSLPRFGDCVLFGWADFFAGVPVARVQLTIRNPNPADHPGGNWDLGNGGSVYLKAFAILPPEGHRVGASRIHYSPEPGVPFQSTDRGIDIYQCSSGGEHWQSDNHLDRHRKIPLRYRGYRLDDKAKVERDGMRATPIIAKEQDGNWFGITTPTFWENFPKRLSADANGFSLNLFPSDSEGETELQGGEQKTHTFYVAFGRDTVTNEPMVWCRSPLVVHADPEWYAVCGIVPYLTPKSTDPNTAYLALVDQAIEGPDTFIHKREKIDEYGWRHFGDIYGDHEAVYHTGPAPMISHYNNQYDCVAGFLYQFFRSGDVRWLTQGLECADHTVDIDVYHTDGDKAAYNRGLFWHTYHYAGADTGTHRSYPKILRRGPQASTTTKMDQLGETAEKLKKSYAVGGGPASSHNYNAGLMLAYYLAGNPLYRDTAVDLAQFVLDMEDPSRTPFRFLSREYTGLATESGGGGYHGPGRASANSILALLVGHQLAGDRKFLDKAEQIIRRVAHPKQNLDRLDLLNAELRWFYTMFLQALGRYLDYKIELGERDQAYTYARLTLLHYARWMADHERPILDTPEKLQYPTETWAAQDMRKVEVFQYAAKHAEGAENARFMERAEWFFRYVESKLSEFPTRSLCRPVVLMMNFGWSRAWWQQHPTETAPVPTIAVSADEFGDWQMFIPQKLKAIKRAKLLVVAGAATCAMLGVALIAWWLI
ncbi:hypothetical protein [Fimbriiglobus ruber]|uniref:PcRGLX/YetA-like N-terminal RIFT barrel domain-containing protein n=1 Tax=Fimbriiglobus ruber TaxID=1908690 RepID=A0A225E6Q9_9BACT|nr:hypothetical protein [Fimbriiglobus ruber]OWK47444.1 hypothetical protein FRUB_01143 [Fimbriiglobus ruber]